MFRHFKAYTIVGIINTIIGYIIGIFLLVILKNKLSVFNISLIASAFSIFFTFNTQRIFVFTAARTSYIRQLLRSYIVYGVLSFLSAFLLDYLINGLQFPDFSALGVVITLTFLISFILNKRYTFR